MTTLADLESRAAQILALRRVATKALLVLAGALLLWSTWCAGHRSGQGDERITQSQRETKAATIIRERITDTVRLAAVVTRRAEARASPLRDTVRIVSRDTIEILIQADSVVRVEVPPAVIRRIVSDSVLIVAQRVELGALRRLVAADSAVIIGQATTIRLLVARGSPRCGRRCGIVLGVGMTLGAVYAAGQLAR